MMGSLDATCVSAAINGESGNLFDSDHYGQVMAVADLLQVMITASQFIKIVNELSGKQCIAVEIASQIVKLAGQRETVSTAWELFLQNVPKWNENWYWEFMSMFDDSAENRDIRNMINEKFDEELKTRVAAVHVDAIPVPQSANAADETNAGEMQEVPEAAIVRIGTAIGKGDSKLTIFEIGQSFEDWFYGKVSAVSTIEQSHESDESDDDEDVQELNLRNYQRELAAPAISRKNTIIVAPTGSGKTFVAVEIVRRHLEAGRCSQTPRKVAFLVPTVNLVPQQTAVFKRYLRRSYKIKGLKGGQVGLKQLPKALVARRNDVLVMTPQILLNMMIDPSPDVEPIPLELFTLLVFDECHHCAKGNPYNEIMTKYLDRKYDAVDSQIEVDLPQVVGLTASVGVGGADTTPAARQHVLSVCANMDAQNISTVVQYQDELAEYVSVPMDELELVRPTYMTHPFSIHLTNLILKIEQKFIMPMFEKLDKSEAASAGSKYSHGFDPPQKKFIADYRNWIYGWMHELPTCQDVEVKQTLITALEHLIVYHNALFLNGHVPTKQAYAYITQRSVEFERNQCSQIDRQLVKLYKDEFVSHVNFGAVMLNEKNPMVEKLKVILLKEFSERPDFRALVFVCTRELTIALMECMNEDPDLRQLGACRLTGVQASKQKGGQSAKEQVEILENFRAGVHKVLIVTSVAEEGLDVEKCNLIVKYNHVTDEISTVQRRGRGRAVGSRSVLLAQDGAVEAKELLNLIKERMMMMAVDYISNMGSEWYKGEVTQRQREAYMARQMEKKITDTKRVLLQGKTYDLLCKRCDAFIVCSTHIRRIAQSHFAAVDPTIWNRVGARPDDLPKLFENMVQAGRLYCNNCGVECGNVIKYVCVYLPALAADAFVQQSRCDTKLRHHQRKWKKMTEELFFIENVTRQDLRSMFNALKSEAILKRLEARIKFAEERQAELELQQQRRMEEEVGNAAGSGRD